MSVLTDWSIGCLWHTPSIRRVQLVFLLNIENIIEIELHCEGTGIFSNEASKINFGTDKNYSAITFFVSID